MKKEKVDCELKKTLEERGKEWRKYRRRIKEERRKRVEIREQRVESRRKEMREGEGEGEEIKGHMVRKKEKVTGCWRRQEIERER